MKSESFNTGWETVHAQKAFPFGTVRVPVMLPYDDLLNETRSPDAEGGVSSGFYPPHVATLEKRFFVPKEWSGQNVVLEFEGVYRDSMVYINREYAGGCGHGYTNYLVSANEFLKYGAENELRVIARSGRDSRWYSGCGIYRGVTLLRGEGAYITPYGLKIRTTEADEQGALLTVSVEMETMQRQRDPVIVCTQVLDADGRIASEGTEPVTLYAGESTVLEQRLYVPQAERWSVERPYLYTVRVTVHEIGDDVRSGRCDGAEDRITDTVEVPFGIRTLSLDAEYGLRINGQTVKLRGTCVHHDNGLLGAADVYRAEERRVQLLKAAGFNAVRSAHNQISRAFMEACDREGMLLMDELTDMWTQAKTEYDYAVSFSEHWPVLIEAMVNKNYNHPSVILYSIGNEIADISHPHGARLARRLAQRFHALDSSRYTINSMNLLAAAMGRYTVSEMVQGTSRDITDVNELMNSLGERLDAFANSDFITEIVRESYSATDILGYNYATGRYRDDRTRLPGHVLCGSETYPAQIAENWAIIRECPHVIGDFTWTGWDYLGEAGIGQIRYQEDGPDAAYGGWPCFLAYVGDLDITGHRRPASYYREIVFGLRKAPYMAVQYPWQHGKTPIANKWAFFDGIASWTWPGYEGRPADVQVYADADRVTLFRNGVPVGEAKVCGYIARFTIIYEPGELTAVAYKRITEEGAAMESAADTGADTTRWTDPGYGGWKDAPASTDHKAGGSVQDIRIDRSDEYVETGRFTLRSASDHVELRLHADRMKLKADDRDLSYIDILITDENGIVQNMADRRVQVSVGGAGMLVGLGSANPVGSDSFRSDTATTHDGHAQAIIRPTGKGVIDVRIAAEGLKEKCLILHAE